MSTENATGETALDVTVSETQLDVLRRATLKWAADDMRRAADELDSLHATADLSDLLPDEDSRTAIRDVADAIDALDVLGLTERGRRRAMGRC